ncbi:KN motif and ankyrin repeat domain-containing protein 1 isoform X2 [Eupeodes corollae]|uniref:KN motif and ankyrin repeat domain-containing protein 1 isoform X2 n=1 Tax=Eupeodes corollae TaxID=290404 RepID=UPI0024936B6B|nr:KN motif and ankyrin repeat domain-containing protein 1 isoform X2 [Eupeodes corollae]
MYAPMYDNISYEENFIDNKWWKKYSCVASHKSRASKQKQQENEVVRSKVPPPPPPRRFKDPDGSSTKNQISPGGTVSEAFTLHSIRQQMAISLNRMKDLEEQVKSIPGLQNQLAQLSYEKQQLQKELQHNKDELVKIKEQATASPVHQTYCSSSPRHSSPVNFTPQRISPISLESLGTRLKSNTSPPSDQLRTINQVLKRDVGIMCVSHTRDVGSGSTPIFRRSVGTNSSSHSESGDIFDKLYTKQELNEHVQICIKEYKEKSNSQKKVMVSVGTQVLTEPKKELRHISVQTITERPVPKFSIGVMARPSLRDVMVSCRPDVRTISCSDHRTTDQLCDKCTLPRRSVASGPDLDEEKKRPLSLKLLDMPGRSHTFSLGENEKFDIKRKTIGTQSQWTTNSIGMQTSFSVTSIGVQNVPHQICESSQCSVQNESRQTDTNDLIKLRTTHVNTDEQPKPIKPSTTNSFSNTDLIRTIDHGVNTVPQVVLKHTSSNTEKLHTREIACGDIVKPHISIACADNYCDSCKDAIKNLAKDFSRAQRSSSLTRDSSKIPRPKHLSSPSPVRKKFVRQNTYTISPSPSNSSVSEEKPMPSIFDENSSHLISLESKSLLATPLSAIARNESNEMKQKRILENISSENEKIREMCHEDGIGDIKDDLIVKEETRVRISWSRENSPAPSTSTSSTVQTVVEKFAVNEDEEKKDAEGEIAKGIEECPAEGLMSENIHTRIEPQPATSQRNQREVQTMIMNQIVSQETAPREKIFPSKEMQAALKVINDSLQKFASKTSDHKSATAVVQTEWFHISSTDMANPLIVEDYLDCFEEFSIALLKYVVNLMDTNGNTAMHYAVSHGNFDVVSILLDSKVCNVNQMNNAGYTCVMLVSLAKLQNSAHRTVVQRLFQMADVNIRAKKHCQTALMLAVSHGNLDMVEMLLGAGADINIQDEDGSTALMCAAEHGRVDIVKHLLSQSDCDSLIQDVDGSTAFKIAWQAGHRDIGLLLYVHEQMLRSKMPSKPEQRTSSLSPRHHKRHPSQ